MQELKIQKKDISKQLWPISVAGTLVFADSFVGEEGFFGIQENHLKFIPIENIPDEFVIGIPEDIEEVQGFLGSAEYLLHRIMMTPSIYIEGYQPSADSAYRENVVIEEVIALFDDFIQTYSKNANTYERIKNGWPR